MTAFTEADDNPAEHRAEIGRRLRRSLRRQKLGALLLIAPLLAFVLVTFMAPIADMLFRSVENQIVADTLPRTISALGEWDDEEGQIPDEEAFFGLYLDLSLAAEKKRHTRVGSRLNYELAGIASLFRKSGRGLRKIETEPVIAAITGGQSGWETAQFWTELFADTAFAAILPQTRAAFDEWRENAVASNKFKPDKAPPDYLFVGLHRELGTVGNSAFTSSGNKFASAIKDAAVKAGDVEIDLKEAFLGVDDGWGDIRIWKTLKLFGPRLTEGYFLNAVDLKKGSEGPEFRPENERLYIKIFIRTLAMSLTITLACAALGYPVAYFLAHLPVRKANLFLILVLLPFWTSLLVRTSAWKVLLQREGVINDILVAVGIVGDGSRLVMINNQFGTIVAMTHILLPFMILPLYSVMKTIPPSYVRAAISLGATSWTAFRRIYFPQTLPGIGAGSILVFILSIGYYITPELVGGTTGLFISNRIAYHISFSLNWGLAAALGTILFAVVIILYWAYDRVIGIDKVKLG